MDKSKDFNSKNAIAEIKQLESAEAVESFISSDEDRTGVLNAAKDRVESFGPVKVEVIEVVPQTRHEGTHMVKFLSNGSSKYLRRANKIHNVTADHGQLLSDKGYGVIID